MCAACVRGLPAVRQLQGALGWLRCVGLPRQRWHPCDQQDWGGGQEGGVERVGAAVPDVPCDGRIGTAYLLTPA